MAQLKTAPRRTSVAAAAIVSGVMKLAVPISSSAPQRPQLCSRSGTRHYVLDRRPSARSHVCMHDSSSSLRLSASDLSNFLACRHLTALDFAHLRGLVERPRRIDAVGERLGGPGFGADTP